MFQKVQEESQFVGSSDSISKVFDSEKFPVKSQERKKRRVRTCVKCGTKYVSEKHTC